MFERDAVARRREDVQAWETYERRKKGFIKDLGLPVVVVVVIGVVIWALAITHVPPAVSTEFTLGYSIVCVAYFMPTIVAIFRKHHQKLAIGVMNLLTGWTVIGWIAALIWACTAVQHGRTA
jgi:hypothetical protein